MGTKPITRRSSLRSSRKTSETPRARRSTRPPRGNSCSAGTTRTPETRKYPPKSFAFSSVCRARGLTPENRVNRVNPPNFMILIETVPKSKGSGTLNRGVSQLCLQRGIARPPRSLLGQFLWPLLLDVHALHLAAVLGLASLDRKST